MKKHVVLLLVSSISLAASSAWALDQQAQARALATKTATSAFRRGPMKVGVSELPSTARRGNDVRVGNSSYSWRGSIKRGWVTKITRMPNGDYEHLEQRRGFFSNYVWVTRGTTVKDGVNRVDTKTEVSTKRTFWRRRIVNKETTDVRTSGDRDTRDTATRTTIKDKNGARSVTAHAVVTQEGQMPQGGHDKGSNASITGKPGTDPKPVVADFVPYNHAEYLRNQPKPW